MTLSSKSSEILRQLPDGLILRRSTHADSEKLAAFNASIHSDDEKPDLRVKAWVSDLLSGNHPTFGVNDFTIVEEQQTGKIVSSMNLISQIWSYAGIPVKVGRPELVGTDPAYRNRGLVKAQFDVIHEWSRQRDELLQGITGIPYYYRQFGYEMAVNLGGGRTGATFNVPRLKEGQAEVFQFRPAAASDVPLVCDLYQKGCRRSLLAAVWDETMWNYELTGKSENNVDRREIRVIETLTGEPLGYLSHPFYLWGETIALTGLEIAPGVSWSDIVPAAIRYLWQTGEALAAQNSKTLTGFEFHLAENHPAYKIAEGRLPQNRRRYAWYLRVPDLAGFLRHITPVLERRLAESYLSPYSGEVKLSFYRTGLNLKFQKDRLVEIEAWQPDTKEYGKASFPGFTFYQLLFGYRDMDELMHAFPDCFTEDELKPVLPVLFPKQPSEIIPIN